MIAIGIISAIMSGMGIGGGAVFIILTTRLFEIGQHEAQALNMILFIAVGISATVFNSKNNKLDKDIIKKIVPFLVVGSILGTKIAEKITGENLKTSFSIFMLIIGIYEIISSLISFKKGKNKCKRRKGEKI